MWYWIWLSLVLVLCAGVFINLDAQSVAFWSLFFLTCAVLFLGYVIASGVTARGRNSQDVAAHRGHVGVLTGLTLIGVVGIEVLVRKTGGLWGSTPFLVLHFSLVFGLVLSYVLARFKYTGVRNKVWHRRLVYSFVAFFIGTYATGSMLLLNQYPLSSFSVVAGER